jgi:phosphopentomutase
MDGLAHTVETLRVLEAGLVWTTLVDLDTTYGHRNDPAGFARQLEAIDARLAGVLEALRPGDLIAITADHGNDPTTPSTDHSREQVPLLAWRRGMPVGRALGVRDSFADVAATLADSLGVPWEGPGKSVWTVLQ